MTKKIVESQHKMIVFEVDPSECPFREFRDNELAVEFWGLGPAAFRATVIALMNKSSTKPSADYIWVDEQTQPLPRSVRQYLHGWARAEELAMSRWEAEVVIFEENNGGKMNIIDTQLSHAQVLLRSSFCRRVLSACFMLERAEGLTVEHQWENFVFSMGPEGWRAKNHIYSPGLKPGGGLQHRPGLSKNGCYLVRLFYLGAWRCVWVSDQVPVDATGSPLLPFSPLLSNAPLPKLGPKQVPMAVSTPVVCLWPLLLCKALLKLAAPDLNSDEEVDNMEDELLPEFNILHALTGGMSLTYEVTDAEELWKIIISEVPVFSWDDDDDTLTSTLKSKSTKKQTTKETPVIRRGSMTNILIADTKDLPPYHLPGITPGHEMNLLITMARDLPLKKPLPEPEVAYWKYYRWVDWARRHGLYEAYDCPRTRFLKVNGLLKLSYSPHLLDVQSTDSITMGFRDEHEKNPPPKSKGGKDTNKSATGAPSAGVQQVKEELREWIQYNPLQELVKNITVLYYPSLFEFSSAASSPPIRITKASINKAVDIAAPKSAPLYLQIDSPDENKLKISLNMLHPRVLFNAGIPIVDFIEPTHLVLEKFEWFIDCDLPLAKTYVSTRGYDAVEVKFQPGRHFCRIWIHSRMNWHLMLLSESTLLLGSRDMIQSAAVRECPWASRFLSALGVAFGNWIKVNRSNYNIMLTADREFYRSYQPDLAWDNDVIGYDRSLLHWMFRQALQSLLTKKLQYLEFRNVCTVLRRFFCDPDFGFSERSPPPKSLRDIVASDPCDCLMPEAEEVETEEEQLEEQAIEEKPVVDPSVMDQLLMPPRTPVVSQVCELATEEVPCGVLKEERDKMIKSHEAAIVLQAHWRGKWARKCLDAHVIITPEVLKTIQENIFGTTESLSALMNEFFRMYPGAKYAYSVASALSGVYGLRQYHGTTHITPQGIWIPYFQGVFYCHAPVKVHFDIQSSLPHSTMAIYNNDTGEQMPQSYNAHITFDISPNLHGYTVMGHGTLNQPAVVYYEAHWQLTVLSCTDGMFHCCDNDEPCHEVALSQASKLHVDEIFLPNRRNILGSIQITVTRHEAVSFRVSATSPDLEMVATLRTLSQNGEMKEVSKCTGKGEIHWPYIRLKPSNPIELMLMKKKSASQANLSTQTGRESVASSARSLKAPKTLKQASKARSTTKFKTTVEPKQYFIDVVAPSGWPLSLQQWRRVDEVRNTLEVKVEITPKKVMKDKPSSAKDKEKEKPAQPTAVHRPEPGDAYIELECSLALGGEAQAKRNDERDLEFAAARRLWDSKEPGRNLRGSLIRREFRAEFLEALPPPPSDSSHTMGEELALEEFAGEDEKNELTAQQGPTPVTESGLLEEMTVESEEEAKYLLMPEQLRDKFIPLHFLPLCTKEKNEDESVLLTSGMAEAAKKDRHARTEAAHERMRELQLHNEAYVLGRQKNRCQLLEKLFVDAQWHQELQDAMEKRDEAIAKEALLRNLSATKKKQDAKKK